MMSFKSNCAFAYLFLKYFVAFSGTQMKNIFTFKSMTTLLSLSPFSLHLSFCMSNLMPCTPYTEDIPKSFPGFPTSYTSPSFPIY